MRHRNAEFLQLRAVADPGVHQQPGRVHRARAHHDFAPGPHDTLLAVRGPHAHSGRPGAVELQAERPCLQGDMEVRPVEEGMQIRDRGRGALVVLRVVSEVEEPHTVPEGLLVEALDARHAERGLRGVDEVACDGVPVGLVDGNDVVAQPAEVRVHRRRVPSGRTGGRPLVPVGRQRLERDQGVVGRTPAEDPGPAVADGRVPAGLLGGGVVVVQLSAEQAHPAAQGQHVVASHVARPALDEGHADARVLGQPGRDHRSGGTAADDHVVVQGHIALHRLCSPFSPRTSAPGAGRGSGRRAWARGTPPGRPAPAPGRCRTCRSRPIPPAAGRGGSR